MFFNNLKSFIRDYLTLTSRERKGALALVVLICVQIMTIIRMHYWSPPEEPVLTGYRLQLERFDKKMAESRSKAANPYLQKKETASAPVFTFFDPNTISDDQWIRLGLSKKQTGVIRNYINKGSRFRNKEGLSKMYCITKEQFQQLEPWIKIPEKELTATSGKLPFPAKKPLMVDLNTADTTLLTELPLIGAGRARLIYKYRERLGGFISEAQLLEVFTIDSTILEAIRPHILVDAAKIRKVNMNSDSLYHPYLNRKAASAIIAYRKQHGNFVDINGLRNVVVLDEQMWRKVAPYAVFE